MSTTKIADIVVPQVLSSMISAEISNFLDFEKTGLVSADYNNVDIRQGGSFAEVRFYNQLDDSDTDEVLEDDKSLTLTKISTGKDIGVVCHRGKSWGSRDLTHILSGDDPQKEIAKQIGKYWAKMIRSALINVLNGNFGVTSGPLGKDATHPHLYNVGVTTSTKVLFSADAALSTMQLLGDAMSDFDVLIVHSKVYKDMLLANLVSWPYAYNPTNIMVDTKNPGKYLGVKDIIVTDNVPVDISTPTYPIYTSYFAKKGCMYLGRQKDLQIETDRDILSFEDVISSSIHYVPHVKLCKWNQTITNPTNAQLATASYWTSVANDHKFIGLAALQSN